MCRPYLGSCYLGSCPGLGAGSCGRRAPSGRWRARTSTRAWRKTPPGRDRRGTPETRLPSRLCRLGHPRAFPRTPPSRRRARARGRRARASSRPPSPASCSTWTGRVPWWRADSRRDVRLRGADRAAHRRVPVFLTRSRVAPLPHVRAILLDARPLVCQSLRASPSRRVSQCAEGCSISSWLAFCSELLHVFFMGLVLAFRDDAHANSHDCARRMCTSHFQRFRTRTVASGGWCT